MAHETKTRNFLHVEHSLVHVNWSIHDHILTEHSKLRPIDKTGIRQQFWFSKSLSSFIYEILIERRNNQIMSIRLVSLSITPSSTKPLWTIVGAISGQSAKLKNNKILLRVRNKSKRCGDSVARAFSWAVNVVWSTSLRKDMRKSNQNEREQWRVINCQWKLPRKSCEIAANAIGRRRNAIATWRCASKTLRCQDQFNGFEGRCSRIAKLSWRHQETVSNFNLVFQCGSVCTYRSQGENQHGNLASK